MSVIEQILAANLAGVRSIFRQMLKKRHTQDEIYEKGDSLMSPYMKKILKYASRPLSYTVKRKNLVIGVGWPDWEYSPQYKYHPSLRVRIPNKYQVTNKGVFLEGQLLCSSPLYLLGLLSIGGIIQFYKVYTTKKAVFSYSDLVRCANRSKKDPFLVYINECASLNSITPPTLDIQQVWKDVKA